MPEGPSLVMYREEMLPFKGKKVVMASGDVKTFPPEKLAGKKLQDIKTWGKHLLLVFPDNFTIRIHFLMFGSYTINSNKDRPERLHLAFARKEALNFYTCSIQPIEQPLDDVYDWSADVMNPTWDAAKALKKIKAQPADRMICDVLLDQDIFAGVGNIIKNEVLYRTGIHPKSKTDNIPLPKLKAMIKDAVAYSFEFLEYRRAGTLKKHWLVHNKKTCPKHETPLHKDHLGKTKRRSFWCDECQQLY
jgi:endonuclease-8